MRVGLAQLKNKKVIAAIIVSLVLIIGLSQSVYPLIQNSITLSCTGQIGSEVYATSGSATAIQAAINSIKSQGGTVRIPAGTFYWNGETVTVPSGVNVIGASDAGCAGHSNNWGNNTATTILHNNKAPPQAIPMFYVDGQQNSHKPSRISGIQFEGTAPTDGNQENNEYGAIEIQEVYGFRIDHCTFVNFCGTAIFADAANGLTTSSCYGLIDHCLVTNPYKESGGPWYWAYGIYARGNMEVGCSPWVQDPTQLYGKFGFVNGATIMYVEDSHIIDCRHFTDGIEGGFPVTRFCKLEQSACGYEAGMICDHGAASQVGDSANAWWSARGLEAYNNTLVGRSTAPWGGTYNNWGVQMRGGSCLFYNNAYSAKTNNQNSYFIVLRNDDNANLVPLQHLSKTYIWGNTYTNCTYISNQGGYAENTDYFLRAPTQAQDGITYTPYQYPNPLTAT
jgi:hypothetical protein